MQLLCQALMRPEVLCAGGPRPEPYTRRALRRAQTSSAGSEPPENQEQCNGVHEWIHGPESRSRISPTDLLRTAAVREGNARDNCNPQKKRTKKRPPACAGGLTAVPRTAALLAEDLYLFTLLTGDSGSITYAMTSAICCWVRTPLTPNRGIFVHGK